MAKSYWLCFAAVIGLFLLNIILILSLLSHQSSRNEAGINTHKEVGDIIQGRIYKDVTRTNYLEFGLDCNVSDKYALNATSRAQTKHCRRQISNIACAIQRKSLFPSFLPNYCPYFDVEKAGMYVGCYRDASQTLLAGYAYQFPHTNSPEYCRFACLRIGFQLSGVQYEYECFCGNLSSLSNKRRVSEHLCTRYFCPGDMRQNCGGVDSVAVYRTGLGDITPTSATYVSPSTVQGDVRILFLLQFNGRNIRQVRRLLKMIYSTKHVYLVHVDKREKIMYREMKRLEQLLAMTISNFRVTENRFSTVWGAASLLTMILSVISDIAVSDWSNRWDYLLNLSETDMPVLSLHEIEAVLIRFMGSSFLRNHGYNSAKYIRKQGLEYVFVECEDRMWRVGDRGGLPNGIRIDGGSDWIVLHKDFAHYAALSSDQLVRGLRKLFETVLLPVETFFHTLAANSKFCDRVVNSNLKHTNWKRKQGCKCQYRSIVDWCGCSPNVVTADDLWKMEVSRAKQKAYWFARKFESIISQTAIDFVESQALRFAPQRLSNRNHLSHSSIWLLDYDASVDDAKVKSEWARVLFSQWRAEMSSQCTAACLFENVSTIHIYKARDNASMQLLAKIRSACGDVELLVDRIDRRYSQIFEGNLNSEFRLSSIDIGTHFDPKEEIFRNYLGLITEHSTPCIRLQWRRNLHSNGTVPSITVIWRPPTTHLQYINDGLRTHYKAEKSISGVQNACFEKLDENYVMESGIWKISVLLNSEQVAATALSVLPADSQMPAFAHLIARSYKIVDYCLDSACNGGQRRSRCSRTEWSSQFPDPKADIDIGYDPALDGLT